MSDSKHSILCGGVGGPSGLDLLLDAPLESRPPLLPLERPEPPADPVLHHGDELLVAEQPVAVAVEDLEDGVHERGRERAAGAHLHGPGELGLADGAVGQRVHAHGDLEVVQRVQEEAEGAEVVEGDAVRRQGRGGALQAEDKPKRMYSTYVGARPNMGERASQPETK